MRVKITRDTNCKFRYLWLKEVVGTSLSQHCAGCLKGTYSDIVNQYTVCETLNLEGKVYYLCGVSQPYNWSKNAHIAFRHKPGSKFKFTNNGLTVEAEDAERIEISTRHIDRNDPHADSPRFVTCRNWQFAHWYRKEYNR